MKLNKTELDFINNNPNSELIDWGNISEYIVDSLDDIETYKEHLVFFRITEERHSSPVEEYLSGCIFANHMIDAVMAQTLFIQYFEEINAEYEKNDYYGNNKCLVKEFLKYYFHLSRSIKKKEKFTVMDVNKTYDRFYLEDVITDEFVLFCRLKGLETDFMHTNTNLYEYWEKYGGKNG